MSRCRFGKRDSHCAVVVSHVALYISCRALDVASTSERESVRSSATLHGRSRERLAPRACLGGGHRAPFRRNCDASVALRRRCRSGIAALVVPMCSEMGARSFEGREPQPMCCWGLLIFASHLDILPITAHDEKARVRSPKRVRFACLRRFCATQFTDSACRWCLTSALYVRVFGNTRRAAVQQPRRHEWRVGQCRTRW